jgi:hypothetical protein
MPTDDTVTLTGVAIENETATIVLRTRKCHADGIDISLSVKLLDYLFDVETFFYGYNFELFLRESEEVISARTDRSHLFNYDQTLVLEFIYKSGVTYLSMNYQSVLPQPVEKNLLKTLQATSHLGSTNKIGSRFSFSFMPLHNSLSEITDWLTRILANHPVSRANPYPH